MHDELQDGDNGEMEPSDSEQPVAPVENRGGHEQEAGPPVAQTAAGEQGSGRSQMSSGARKIFDGEDEFKEAKLEILS